MPRSDALWEVLAAVESRCKQMDCDSREQVEYQTMCYKNQYWLINVIYPLFIHSLSSLTMLQAQSSIANFTRKSWTANPILHACRRMGILSVIRLSHYQKIYSRKEYVNSETRTVFWEVKLCSLIEVYRRFRGTCFHSYGQIISRAIKQIIFLDVKFNFLFQNGALYGEVLIIFVGNIFTLDLTFSQR